MSNLENVMIRMSPETAKKIRGLAHDLSNKERETINAVGHKRTIYYTRVTLGTIIEMAMNALERELAAKAEDEELPDHIDADDIEVT
jgi:hypothetical protein